jgi:uncharacterized protein (TIGR02246 family)
MAITPQDAIDQVDEAFNRGNLDTVISYYEENAVWVVKPGNIVSGKPALRKEFEKIFRTNPHIILQKEHLIECSDIALFSGKWRLISTDLDGSSLDTEGFASTILRRQLDGHWRIVIDNPWGPEIFGPDGIDAPKSV